MKRLAALSVILFLFIVSQAHAEVRSDVLRTIDLDGAPLDMASSADGRMLFVLTEGTVSVFSLPDGRLIGTIGAGKGLDRIAGSPQRDLLMLGNSKHGTVSIVSLDFIKTFDFTGSPVRGSTDAPVTIVAFSDFQ